MTNSILLPARKLNLKREIKEVNKLLKNHNIQLEALQSGDWACIRVYRFVHRYTLIKEKVFQTEGPVPSLLTWIDGFRVSLKLIEEGS